MYEVVNMYHGYVIRKRRKEEMLAQFVTLWIANTAGRSLKKEVTMKQLFRDGRFNKQYDDKETKELLGYAFGEEVE